MAFFSFLLGGALLAAGLTLLKDQDGLLAFIGRFSTDGLDDNIRYSLSQIGLSFIILGCCIELIPLSLAPIGGRSIYSATKRLFFSSTRRFLATLLTVSAVVNVLLILVIPFQPWADFLWYHERAIDIMNGHGVVVDGKPSAFWPIGYSLFLAPFYAVFGSHIIVAQLVNIALRMILVALTYLIGRRIFDELTGRRACAAMAFFPSPFFYTMVTNSDLLFAVIYALVIWLMLWAEHNPTWKIDILLGLMLGAGSYVRPILLPFIAVVFLWTWSISHTLKKTMVRCSLICLMTVAALSPWVYRNYQVFDRLILVSTNGGYNLYVGNNPLATGGYNTPRNLEVVTADMGELAKDEFLRTAAVDYIKQNPGRFALNAARKAVHLYMRDDQGVSFATKTTYRELPPWLLGIFLIGSDLYYYLVFFSAFCAILFNLRHRRMGLGAILVGVSIVYVSAVYMVFFGADRFHLCVLFAFTIFAASLPIPAVSRHKG